MKRNMKKTAFEVVSDIFETLQAPARVQILCAIGREEVCVCHLEASLGMRQAYISQQLMELREKGILAFRREGKFSFYRLQKPDILNLLFAAARMAEVPEAELMMENTSGCDCPRCAEE
jgi:DNA-binding transcriptional ArsR family regulator